MKRYMTGMVTGSLVGALVAGVWLLRGRRAWSYRRIFHTASKMAPQVVKMVRRGTNMARRKIS